MAMNGSFRTLTFDGEISTDYGVYISGEGTFNAPLRDVEMITIPGRNGAYALDNGRFENIEVTYPAGLFGVDEEDFARKISAFRNFLCSRVGYVRLEDDYNPDEYRLAVYKSGLEVDPELLKAGRFDLVFECKPQRFLKSGESEITLSTGSNTVTNPTLFKSSPIIKAQGYGDFNINGETIRIENREIGFINLPLKKEVDYGPDKLILKTDLSLLNNGDPITVKGLKYSVSFKNDENLPVKSFGSPIWTVGSGSFVTNSYGIQIFFDDFTTQNVIGGSETVAALLFRDVTLDDDSKYELKFDFHIDNRVFNYPGQIYCTSNAYYKSGTNNHFATTLDSVGFSISAISTKTITNVINIDLDIGEAYIVDDGRPVQINEIVTIPAVLPTLKPGDNSITVDGENITQASILPRWWKV